MNIASLNISNLTVDNISLSGKKASFAYILVNSTKVSDFTCLIYNSSFSNIVNYKARGPVF